MNKKKFINQPSPDYTKKPLSPGKFRLRGTFEAKIFRHLKCPFQGRKEKTMPEKNWKKNSGEASEEWAVFAGNLYSPETAAYRTA